MINRSNNLNAVFYLFADLAFVHLQASKDPVARAQTVSDGPYHILGPLPAPDDHDVAEIEPLMPVVH